MDIEFAKASLLLLVGNLIYAVVAVIIGVAGLKLVDWILLRKIDIEEEIKKGNIAAAIFGATILLFVAILIGLSLGR